MGQTSKGFCLHFIITAFCTTINAKSLVVGLPMLEPYTTQQNGEISGLYVEMLQSVFRKIGVDRIVIRLMPPSRATHEFMRGNLDVALFSNDLQELSRFAYLTKEPLNIERVVLMGRTNSPLEEGGNAHLLNASVAAIRGFSSKSSILKKKELTLVNSREQLLKVLFAGRVEYIVTEEDVTSIFARKCNFPPVFSVTLLEDRLIFVAFSKLRLGDDAKSLGVNFDVALRQFHQRGEWKKILETYREALPQYIF